MKVKMKIKGRIQTFAWLEALAFCPTSALLQSVGNFRLTKAQLAGIT